MLSIKDAKEICKIKGWKLKVYPKENLPIEVMKLLKSGKLPLIDKNNKPTDNCPEVIKEILERSKKVWLVAKAFADGFCTGLDMYKKINDNLLEGEKIKED